MTAGAVTPPPNRSFKQRGSSALSYLILLAGIASIGVAAYMVVLCYTPLPWADGWGEIFAPAFGEKLLSLQWLWAQHNEHRLLIPKLFLIADLRLFRARQTFLLASIFVIQILHLCLLSWSMRALGGWRGPLWRAATGLAAFCLFCPTQWENLTWGFQTCFVLPPLFGTVSFVGLLLYWKHDSWKYVLLSLLAGLAAVLSLASGLVLLPLLTGAALALRLKKSVILTYATAAAAIILLYFHNYVRPAQNTDPVSSLHSPGKLLGYLASYFGSTWTVGSSWTHHNVQIAPWIGFIGLALWLIFALRVRRRDQQNSFPVLLVLLSVFCLGTAFLTALGRVTSGYSQAFSSRYQTVALLFWFSLGCLVLAFAQRWPQICAIAIQALLLLAMVRGALLLRFPLRDAREHAFQMRAATAALLTGIDDRQQISEANGAADQVLAVVPFMREQRLSIFAGDEAALFGSPLFPKISIANDDRCEAAIQAQTVFRDANGRVAGLRISGWVWDKQRRRPANTVLMVANGKVVGLGALGDWRPTIRAGHPEMNTSFIGFTAYANGAVGVTPYATLVGSPSQACEITSIVFK
jgi:hypothetical protein